jgi:cysteine desulfurase
MNKPALMSPIYMDHNATTPTDARVFAAMKPWFEQHFGNASSHSHAYGWQAQTAVKRAREQMAALLGCEPKEVLWTSGATESNNLAILGVVGGSAAEPRPHLITQATEHKAVLEVFEAAGCEVTVLPVNSDGLISAQQVAQALRPNTLLVSVMMANNEVGTIQPIADIAELCHQRKVIFHCDAAQAVGKLAIDLRHLSIDLLSLSGHKIYGPKGVGALIHRPINRAFEIKPLMFGGEQEKKLRPGTLNVPGIVGLGEACALAQSEMAAETQRLNLLQEQILTALLSEFPQVKLNGPRHNRLANNLSLSFPDLAPDAMILDLSGVAYSSGSACNSANARPSHVLTAMGLKDDLARSTVRLGLGRSTSPEDVQTVTDKLLKMLRKTYSPNKLSRLRPLLTL